MRRNADLINSLRRRDIPDDFETVACDSKRAGDRASSVKSCTQIIQIGCWEMIKIVQVAENTVISWSL